MTLAEFERVARAAYLEELLPRHKTVVAAARAAGVNRSAFYRMCRKAGVAVKVRATRRRDPQLAWLYRRAVEQWR